MPSETKNCQNCKTDFTIEPDDFSFYEKMQVPPPTFCPECRLIRRLAFRNERSLYKNTCKKCNKAVISVFPEDSGMQVYCRPCWWSDDWDAAEYGKDFDPTKPFLLQLKELLLQVPVPSLFGIYHTLIDSEYTNMVTGLKNCYMLTHSDFDENCAYGSCIDHCTDCNDNMILLECELCFQCVNCQKCYKTSYSVDCESCHDTYFSNDCVGCAYVIGCVGLRNKKYCVFNEEVGPEKFKQLLEEMKLGTRAGVEKTKKKAHEYWKQFPKKYTHERHNAAVSGDYIYNSKNTRDSFIVTDMEDSRFCAYVIPGKTTSCYDFTHYGMASELMYEALQCGNHSSNIKFSWYCALNALNIEYSMYSMGSKNIFGCVGTRKKEYCILNNQYTKDEYEILRSRIIDQMNTSPYISKSGAPYCYGEFFPPEFSPFGYNATTAQEYFPLSNKDAPQKGFNWKEQEKIAYKITKNAESLPETISEVDENILTDVIGCAHNGTCAHQCSTAFRIVPQELAFYKRNNIPLPSLCPNCRYMERAEFRNPFKLWHRSCMCEQSNHFHDTEKCTVEFETSYSPERPEIVYCEKCYQQEVV